MRVVNDKQEKVEPPELNFFSVASHAILSAVGISTVIFSPLPIIVAHLRLAEPWCKVAALLGAVFALVSFFQVPLPLVIVCFVFGVFVGDQVAKQVPFWRLLGSAAVVASIAGLGSLYLSAQLQQMTVISYWKQVVQNWISLVQSQWEGSDPTAALAMLNSMFVQQAPFSFLALVVFSLWMSIGIASHLGWVPEGHAYSGKSLRLIRLSPWVSLAFGVALLVSLFGKFEQRYLFEGAARLLGSLMFMQGCVALSNLMNRRQAKQPIRTLAYAVCISIGFYMLVGLGVLSPWLKLNKVNSREAK